MLAATAVAYAKAGMQLHVCFWLGIPGLKKEAIIIIDELYSNGSSYCIRSICVPYYAHVKLFLLYSFDFHGRLHSNHLHLMAA